MSKKMFLVAPIALMIATLAVSAHDRRARVAVAFRGPTLTMLARDVDRAARDLSVQATAEIFPRGRKRVEALETIRQFELDARRFRAVVENRVGQARLAYEIDRLEQSFDRTAWVFDRNVRPSRFLVADFRNVEVSMSRLTDRF